MLFRTLPVSSRQGASRVWLGLLLTNLVFLILFCVYPSTSSNVFATFLCMVREPPD